MVIDFKCSKLSIPITYNKKKNLENGQTKFYGHSSIERQATRVCNKGWSHKCSPTFDALFHYGQQGYSEK